MERNLASGFLLVAREVEVSSVASYFVNFDEIQSSGYLRFEKKTLILFGDVKESPKEALPSSVNHRFSHNLRQ